MGATAVVGRVRVGVIIGLPGWCVHEDGWVMLRWLCEDGYVKMVHKAVAMLSFVMVMTVMTAPAIITKDERRMTKDGITDSQGPVPDEPSLTHKVQCPMSPH